MSKAEKNKGLDLSLIRRILSYTKPYKGYFFSSLILTLVLAGIAIVRPLLINKALNDYVVTNQNLSGLNTICLIILGSLILEGILQFGNIYMTSYLGQSIVKDLRNQVYGHIVSLRNSYFDKTPVGMLVTRAISDIESLSDVFAQGFIVISGDIVMLLVFVIVMFVKNWVLSLIVLTTVPLLLVATALFKNGVKKTFTEVRNAVAALNTFTQEHITGMRVVQLFNREEAELEKFKAINDKHRIANIRSIWYYSIFFPVVEILSAIAIGALIWFIGVKSDVYHVGLGDITFFIMMVNMLFRPIRMLADRLNTLQMGIVSAERVFKVLDTNEIIPDEGKHNLENIRGDIEFKNVWFAYNEEDYVLKDVSFSLKGGQSLALVGPTGAGKSTIINLLSRFYEINKGEIALDGVDIRDYRLDELRRNTGVVLQDVHLFNDSIYNNIALHNPAITIGQVIAASKQIGLHDFVSSLPGGYDYVVKERGAGLSAGQRQLIAFIRAYVYDPKLFVLDEATATIDSHTEKLMQTATEQITRGRTSIIIAHRLSTIRNVDKIIVFEKGQIAEEGTQAELIRMNGHFKRLYELQFAEV